MMPNVISMSWTLGMCINTNIQIPREKQIKECRVNNYQQIDYGQSVTR